MLNWIKFRREQYKIERWMDEISRKHKDAEKKAREKGASSEELYDLGHEYHYEQLLAEDEMIRLTSSYYLRLANRMLIPVPEFKAEGGAWKESQQTGLYHLTPQALHELRTIIRAEEKARREEWTVWLVLATGIIGTLSGLIAIIKK